MEQGSMKAKQSVKNAAAITATAFGILRQQKTPCGGAENDSIRATPAKVHTFMTSTCIISRTVLQSEGLITIKTLQVFYRIV